MNDEIWEEIAQLSEHLGWWASDTQDGLEDAHRYLVECGCTKAQALYGIEMVIRLMKGEYGG